MSGVLLTTNKGRREGRPEVTRDTVGLNTDITYRLAGDTSHS